VATYGVISDVHGNLEALTAVLAVLDRERVDQILCLGDLVGYNAESDECVDLLQRRNVESIAGNHDLIATGHLGFEKCSMRPEFALRQTRKILHPATRTFLERLPRLRVYEDDIVTSHGGIDDVSTYLRSARDLADNARRLRRYVPRARICFFGHTHVAGIYEVRSPPARGRDGADFDVVPVEDEELGVLDQARLTFINPGSVDAARRDEKLAEFAIFDSEAWSVSLRQVPYDATKAEESARRGGFRMSTHEEAIYRARRLVTRGQRKVAKLLRQGGLRLGG
jgi:predicted phosphodiesterase